MKIATASQIRELDQFTIENEPIPSLSLMERASQAFVKTFLEEVELEGKTVVIFCGAGNNGGDGLAIARLLAQRELNVVAYRVEAKRYTEDNKRNARRFETTNIITSIQDILPMDKNTVIIDALIGSGLKEQPRGLYKNIIEHINNSDAYVVAVDIPSGLYSDVMTEEGNVIVRAALTITFELPKLSFLMPETEAFVGVLKIVSIVLHPEGVARLKTDYHFISTDVPPTLEKRSRFAHKGTFGHALLIGGSYGKIGAIQLASKACLRSGIGLLSIQAPRCGYTILQTSVPEAMLVEEASKKNLQTPIAITSYSAIGIGPGLGLAKKTRKWLKYFLNLIQRPLVLDADALNALAMHPKWFKKLPQSTIITPHPKEFQRLFGGSMNRFTQLDLAKKKAKEHSIIIVLKGAYTAIVNSDAQVYFNNTGNSGMATGGSGDVLTGIITGYLAQGIKPIDAAILGVYNHGLAADKAYESRGNGLIASDIIDCF